MKVITISLNSVYKLKHSGNPDKAAGPEAETSSIENLNIQINSFTEIDSTGILMFLYRWGRIKGKRRLCL
ncbi:hypothetical protein SAMN05880574_13312 [Chryseobacterium sp. RU37D]|uniref:hypothetical protein n=1 Tax=Chryseobacterium sp. RU37D TaxID=1907397 RepID=UPI00095496E0|nr:hypothetical protein [Chryseobacterium sp. RU37D]SIQ91226.1 hypothetical protein SAMN05880574_13312 [Chryseobacterium sp. RU37D]